MPGSTPAYDRFLAALNASGAPHRIHAHAASVTFQDAADFLDFPLDRLIKTIAFRVKNGPWVLAALRGRDRVDYKKLSAHLGVNRTQLMSLPPEAVEAELDYPLGGVAPFPTRPNIRIVFDWH
ncbi:MAG: YbaK/EbsC family protein, partial [Anaerolineales bacterium]